MALGTGRGVAVPGTADGTGLGARVGFAGRATLGTGLGALVGVVDRATLGTGVGVAATGAADRLAAVGLAVTAEAETAAGPAGWLAVAVPWAATELAD